MLLRFGESNSYSTPMIRRGTTSLSGSKVAGVASHPSVCEQIDSIWQESFGRRSSTTTSSGLPTIHREKSFQYTTDYTPRKELSTSTTRVVSILPTVSREKQHYYHDGTPGGEGRLRERLSQVLGVRGGLRQ